MSESTTAAAGSHYDPYKLTADHIEEPPQGLGKIMGRIGPGLVLSASIVGSGELIATTTLGAKLGYTMMWLIIVSCLIKSIVQAALGRYVICTGETTLSCFSRVPGPAFCRCRDPPCCAPDGSRLQPIQGRILARQPAAPAGRAVACRSPS